MTAGVCMHDMKDYSSLKCRTIVANPRYLERETKNKCIFKKCIVINKQWFQCKYDSSIDT